jgi:hypothetical protein
LQEKAETIRRFSPFDCRSRARRFICFAADNFRSFDRQTNLLSKLKKRFDLFADANISKRLI